MRLLLFMLIGVLPFCTNAEVCSSSDIKINKEYYIAKEKVRVFQTPSKKSKRIINKKLSRILDSTQYIEMSPEFKVVEVCQREEWSYVKTISPSWLRDSHKGWVLTVNIAAAMSRYMKKTKASKSKKISSSIFKKYDKPNYPSTFKKYPKRLKEIQKLRIMSAKRALSTGKCDYVVFAELSEKSTNTLRFWVECRNKKRFRYDEYDFK